MTLKFPYAWSRQNLHKSNMDSNFPMIIQCKCNFTLKMVLWWIESYATAHLKDFWQRKKIIRVNWVIFTILGIWRSAQCKLNWLTIIWEAKNGKIVDISKALKLILNFRLIEMDKIYLTHFHFFIEFTYWIPGHELLSKADKHFWYQPFCMLLIHQIPTQHHST